MKEQVNNLFDNEDEGHILAIPVTVAFKHSGSLIMNKGYSRKASEWYPNLPEALGWWHRQHSREPFVSYEYNVVSFAVKLSTKESTKEKLVEYSFQKLKTLIESTLYSSKIFIPLQDPLYEEVDAITLGRYIFKDIPNIILVRELLL